MWRKREKKSPHIPALSCWRKATAATALEEEEEEGEEATWMS